MLTPMYSRFPFKFLKFLRIFCCSSSVLNVTLSGRFYLSLSVFSGPSQMERNVCIQLFGLAENGQENIFKTSLFKRKEAMVLITP